MNRSRVKGTMDELTGIVKQKTGEITGDNSLRIEGIAQEVKGKLENAWGKAKDTVSKAAEEARTEDGTRPRGTKRK